MKSQWAKQKDWETERSVLAEKLVCRERGKKLRVKLILSMVVHSDEAVQSSCCVEKAQKKYEYKYKYQQKYKF